MFLKVSVSRSDGGWKPRLVRVDDVVDVVRYDGYEENDQWYRCTINLRSGKRIHTVHDYWDIEYAIRLMLGTETDDRRYDAPRRCGIHVYMDLSSLPMCKEFSYGEVVRAGAVPNDSKVTEKST